MQYWFGGLWPSFNNMAKPLNSLVYFFSEMSYLKGLRFEQYSDILR